MSGSYDHRSRCVDPIETLLLARDFTTEAVRGFPLSIFYALLYSY